VIDPAPSLSAHSRRSVLWQLSGAERQEGPGTIVLCRLGP
jgi:hypothetical protein